MLVERGDGTLFRIAEDGSNNNTLQNSVVRDAITNPGRDNNCVNVHSARANGAIRGTRIVANELYNCSDGVQLVALEATSGSIYPGTIIADNDMYLTPDYYTDCNGNRSSSGDCSCGENAIDTKGGGVSGDDVLIEGNRAWGFRNTDRSCSSTGSRGAAMVFGNYPQSYFRVIDNVVMDSPRGFSITRPRQASFTGNLLFNINDPSGEDAIGIYSSGGTSNFEFSGNTLVDAQGVSISGANHEFVCNVVVRGEVTGSNVHADLNAYYEARQLASPGSEDVVRPTVNEARLEPRMVHRRRWTGPETVLIPDAVTTDASPHAQLCDSN